MLDSHHYYISILIERVKEKERERAGRYGLLLLLSSSSSHEWYATLMNGTSARVHVLTVKLSKTNLSPRVRIFFFEYHRHQVYTNKRLETWSCDKALQSIQSTSLCEKKWYNLFWIESLSMIWHSILYNRKKRKVKKIEVLRC